MPEQPTSIINLLERAASTNAGISIYAPGSAPSRCDRTTYHDFLQKARINAQSVRRIKGISEDSIVLLHFDRHSDHFDWFWAVTIAGFTPAISTPFVNDLDQRRKHLNHLFNVFQDPIILTTSALSSEFLDIEQLRIRTIESIMQTKQQTNGHVDGKMSGTTNGCIDGHHNEATNGNSYEDEDLAVLINGRVDGSMNGTTNGSTNGRRSETLNDNAHSVDDLAVLMLTSGSTGNAKAVSLRHSQIIQSVKGKSLHLELCSDDTLLNWIGMDHAVNLIEMHLHAMYLCAEQVHVQASDLLMEPLTFLRLIDKHRVSYAFSPNFFLASLKRALSGIDTRSTNIDFDLSCLKALMCGGEANVVSNLDALSDLLFQFGVKPGFLRPGFGMTETCAASVYGRDCPSYDLERGLEYAATGSCIPGMDLRITKDEGPQKFVNREAEVDEVGHIQLHGEVVFQDYFNNPVATEESFTEDGWFITGDKGYIDDHGKLNLTGRSKETIIINGVKYFPYELETAIEQSFVSGVTPSYTVVFPYRPRDSQTEELCVVYLPSFDRGDPKAHTETAEAISNVTMMIASIRPYRIIPLTKELLPKSSLGKLSRAKIRAAFESGAYRTLEEESNKAIKSYRVSKQEVPTTELEMMISAVFCEMFDLPPDVAWVGSSLFDFGITSIDLISFKQRVQNRLALGREIPVLMIMKNPTIRGMAEALQTLAQGSRPYNAVVTLQSKGTKTPLWIVHPGTGEVLVYVGLVKYITDRPLYALRARGFESEEEGFDSTSEAAATYFAHLKQVQPTGPYAIAGWSQGFILAYELTRLIEANGDKIVLCASLDTAPDIAAMGGVCLSRKDVLIHLRYLLDLTPKRQALEDSAAIYQRTPEEALIYILELTPAKRRQELEIDLPKLATWAEVMCSLFAMLDGWEPSGDVETMDVFYAANSGLMRHDIWMEHIRQWNNFSRSTVDFHECAGEHHTMLTGDINTFSFQKALKKVLKAKGI